MNLFPKPFDGRVARGLASATVLLGALGISGQASALVVDVPTDAGSLVHTTIDDGAGAGGNDIFNYEVENTTPAYGGNLGALIVDWEMPWVGDPPISEIQSPFGWDYAIEDIGTPNPERGWGGIAGWQETGDPWNDYLLDVVAGGGADAVFAQAFLDATQVLHWYITPDFFNADNCSAGPVTSNDAVDDCSWGWFGGEGGLSFAIEPDSSLDGFSFEAPASTPVDAPYQASWFELPVITGDPPFPGAPGNLFFPSSALPAVSSVPEPSALGLLGGGLAAFGVSALRRKRQD